MIDAVADGFRQRIGDGDDRCNRHRLARVAARTRSQAGGVPWPGRPRRQRPIGVSCGCVPGMSGARDLRLQVVGIGAADLDVGPVAGLELLAGFRDTHDAIDLRRVGCRACNRAVVRVDVIDEDAHPFADLGGELFRADRRRHLHEAREPLFLHFLGHRVGQRVGRSAGDRRVFEAADAIEPSLTQPVEQQREIRLRLAGEADDERAAQRDVRAHFAPPVDAFERVLGVRRTLHQLQHARTAVLERDVEVRQDPAVGHQRDHVVDVRIRVHVVQAHPGTE